VDSSHQKWSKAYNDEWEDFFRKEDRTVDEILDQARKMAEKFGFKVNF
jgi:hypothetical protein